MKVKAILLLTHLSLCLLILGCHHDKPPLQTKKDLLKNMIPVATVPTVVAGGGEEEKVASVLKGAGIRALSEGGAACSVIYVPLDQADRARSLLRAADGLVIISEHNGMLQLRSRR